MAQKPITQKAVTQKAVTQKAVTQKVLAMWLFFLLALGLSVTATTARAQASSYTLKGEGLYLSQGLMQDVVRSYPNLAQQYLNLTIGVSYEPKSSREFINDFLAQKVDFIISARPLTELEQASSIASASTGEANRALHVPIGAMALVPVFNFSPLYTITSLNLDGESLAGIYSGSIRYWDDPKIKALNPELNLPKLAITVYHPQDSGLNYIFLQYLAKIPFWQDYQQSSGQHSILGVDNFPHAFALSQVELISAVQEVPGAISFVSLNELMTHPELKAARMYNDAGRLQEANIMSLEESLRLSPSLYDLNNSAGQNAWPIGGILWLILFQDQGYAGRALEHARQLITFSRWFASNAQPLNNTHYFVATNATMQSQALATLDPSNIYFSRAVGEQ